MIRLINANDINVINQMLSNLDNNGKLKKEDLNQPYFNCIVYQYDNQIIGLLKFSVIYDRVEIDYIYVMPMFRNNKVAFKLLNYLIESLDKNITNITLEVNCKNEIAINLYKKNGFKKIAIRKKYYGNDDAFLMIKELIK